MHIRDVMSEGKRQGASDIHITVGRPPIFRIHGELQLQDQWEVLIPAKSEALAKEIATTQQWNEFLESGQIDIAYSMPGVARFRVNIFRQRGSVALSIRIINAEIASIQELGLPEVIQTFAGFKNGLVLVTGPTGSGKSATLAAILDQINKNRSSHIITLEDPIEYLHKHEKSIVNQREVGNDSKDFAGALRGALRQDPDVILVGEMRDFETISTVITAAETGHLVLATLHTKGAPQTIDRIIDVFPPHQQEQVRSQLAEILQAVMCQVLLPRIDVPGRIVATEIMLANNAVRSLIREGKTHQLYSCIQTSGKLGMQTMASCLQRLYKEGKISAESAGMEVGLN